MTRVALPKVPTHQQAFPTASHSQTLLFSEMGSRVCFLLPRREQKIYTGKGLGQALRQDSWECSSCCWPLGISRVKAEPQTLGSGKAVGGGPGGADLGEAWLGEGLAVEAVAGHPSPSEASESEPEAQSSVPRIRGEGAGHGGCPPQLHRTPGREGSSWSFYRPSARSPECLRDRRLPDGQPYSPRGPLTTKNSD